jgi:hypothetical protein
LCLARVISRTVLRRIASLVRVIAGALDGRDQLPDASLPGVIANRRRFRREVDRRRGAGHAIQHLLDARGARRARHPFETELDGCGGVGDVRRRRHEDGIGHTADYIP